MRQVSDKVNFKFDIDWRWPKRSWFDRFCARHVAKMILNADGDTYQFGGWTGAKRENYEMINADKFQLMHWILRESGYQCNTAQVMYRVGVDPDKRKV